MDILIIDDEVNITLDIESFLYTLEYTHCYRATTPKKALLIANTQHIDLVIMDINLQADINGIELAKQIKNIYPDIVLIYLTSFDDEKTIEEAIQTNPSSYLTKPFKESDLKVQLQIIKNKNNLITNQQSYENYIFDENFSFNTHTKILYHNNVEINLRKKELLLLDLIIKNMHTKNITYEQIDYTIWEDKTVSNTTRRTLINSLNKKFNFKILKSNYINGYTILT